MPKIDLLKSKILIVDDESANVRVLEQMLEDEGFSSVRSTMDSREVCGIYKEFWPNLVLLDLNMPHMDGFQVMEGLKKVERRGYLPVLVLTALKDRQTCIKALSMGAKDFLTKPFDLVEALCRIRNILEARLLHDQLRNYGRKLLLKNKQLEELNDERIKLLGMASHDLRSPLTVIKGFSELLMSEREDLSEDVRESVEIIHSSSRELLNLVENLLDVSVIESGKLVLNPQPGSLKDVVGAKVKILRFIAAKKKIELTATLEDVPIFSFDSNRIGQALDNLIGNAIKFSPFGKNINVSLELKGNSAKVSVKDQGPGISMKDQEKIFKPFQKSEAKPTDDESSAGLGLAIVKKMVEEHRGTLQVESQPGVETIFSFFLPLGKATGKVAFSKLKVLLVEGEIADMTLIKHHLEMLGVGHILDADDGDVALQRLNQEKFDLVISAWKMPVMSGLGLLTSIRKNPALSSVPFLMVTACKDETDVQQAVGVEHYMVKPFERDALEKKIEEALAGSG